MASLGRLRYNDRIGTDVGTDGPSTPLACPESNGMLILSRKLGESITIDKNIVITITKIEGSAVQIGIEAPREIKVYRQELAEKINSAKSLTAALE